MPSPYSCTVGSVTPSELIRVVMVSIEFCIAFFSIACCSLGFSVSVNPSAVEAMLYCWPYFVSSTLRASLDLSAGTPLIWMVSGSDGFGFKIEPACTPAACRSGPNRPSALSVSALTASSTITCSTRCVPPFRSRPRLIRFAIASFHAWPLTPLGMPKIPKTKTSRMAMMRTVLLVRFLRMMTATWLPRVKLLGLLG